MNFLLAREGAEEHAVTKSCFYCNKVFSNYRALGGHLRVHQDGRILRTLNYPSCSVNSVNITGNPPASLPNSQPNSFAGFNSPTPLTTAPPAFDFSWMFYLNEMNQVSRSHFIGGYPGLPQPQIITSPDFSYGCGFGATYHHNSLASQSFAPVGSNVDFSYGCGYCATYHHNSLAAQAFASVGGYADFSYGCGYADFSYGCGYCATYHHNSLSSLSFAPVGSYADFSCGCGYCAACHRNVLALRASAPVGMNAAMPSAAFASSGSVVAPGFPVDSSLFLGSNGVCQFNTSGFQISLDGFPPSFGGALPNIQGYTHGPPISGSGNVGRYDRRSFLSHEERKRPYVADKSRNAEITNASKKPRIAPNEHAEPENPPKKELPLFVDVVDPISASETCCSAEEEDPVDIDLSLHL